MPRLPRRTFEFLGPALLLFTSALLGACAMGLAESSAEPTGCAAESISISDVRSPVKGAPITWAATCEDGPKFFCMQTPDRTICSTDERGPQQAKK